MTTSKTLHQRFALKDTHVLTKRINWLIRTNTKRENNFNSWQHMHPLTHEEVSVVLPALSLHFENFFVLRKKEDKQKKHFQSLLTATWTKKIQLKYWQLGEGALRKILQILGLCWHRVRVRYTNSKRTRYDRLRR